MNRTLAQAHAGAGLLRAIIRSDDPYYDRLALDIKRIITKAEHNIAAGHAKELIEALQGGPAAFERAMAILTNGFRAELGPAVTDAVTKRVVLAYTRGTVDVLGTTQWEFNLADEKAMKWLGKDATYWVGEYYGPEFSQRVTQLMMPAFDEGLGLRALRSRLSETLGGEFTRSASYWQGFANNVTTRSRAFGLTEGATRAGFQKGRISAILDGATSTICRTLDGKTVYTADMRQLRDDLVSATDPEAVKRIAPWRTSDAEVSSVQQTLAATGRVPAGLSLPPYHYHCRTFIVFE
jgi:hypothetical protein